MKNIKTYAKEFWKEYGDYIKLGALIGGTFMLGWTTSDKYKSLLINTGFAIVVAKTPELTVGEFQKQVLNGTFDYSKYQLL